MQILLTHTAHWDASRAGMAQARLLKSKRAGQTPSRGSPCPDRLQGRHDQVLFPYEHPVFGSSKQPLQPQRWQ